LDEIKARGGLTVRQEKLVVVNPLKEKVKDHTPLAGPPKLSVTQKLKLKKDQKESLGLKRRVSNGTVKVI